MSHQDNEDCAPEPPEAPGTEPILRRDLIPGLSLMILGGGVLAYATVGAVVCLQSPIVFLMGISALILGLAWALLDRPAFFVLGLVLGSTLIFLDIALSYPKVCFGG